MVLRVCLLLGLLTVVVAASHNETSTSVSVSDALIDRDPAGAGTTKRRSSTRRRVSDSVRNTRSRLAHSCEEGGDLLTQWYRHCQIVLTAAVEGVDRERGTLNVTLRRVIRSSVNASDWSFLSPAEASSANNLNPLPWRPAIILHDLFDARRKSCSPQFRIRTHDVLLFLVRVDPLRKSLHLVSSPLRITLRNLRLIHSSPVQQRIGEFLIERARNGQRGSSIASRHDRCDGRVNNAPDRDITREREGRWWWCGGGSAPADQSGR